MNKYTTIFKFSFIIYIMFFVVKSFVSVEKWISMVELPFYFTILYQLIYLFILRKKDNQSFSNVIIMYLAYGITSLTIFLLVDYIDIYINGYTKSNWVPWSYNTYYGIEAIKKDYFKNIITFFVIIFNIKVIIVYKHLSRKNKKDLIKK